MKSRKITAAKWAAVILLLAGAMFSYAALFNGNIPSLIAGAVCLIGGLYALKVWLSSQ